MLPPRAGFLLYCRLELQLAEHTLAAYGRDLERMDEACVGLGLRLDDIGPEEVGHLLGWLKEQRGYAPASLVRTLVALRMFVRWLVLDRQLAADRIALAPMPHLWNRLPEVLGEDEVLLLLESIPPGPMWLRDRLAIELLYATGGRASEVAGLTLADLKERGALLLLHGKGNKDRMVPVGGPARYYMKRYLSELRPTLATPGDDHLLLNRRGHGVNRQDLWRIVRSAAIMAGFDKRVYTHLLRHACATHLIAGGADLRSVQELLGHANLTTTQRYTHVDARRLVEVHRRFHPRSRSAGSPVASTPKLGVHSPTTPGADR